MGADTPNSMEYDAARRVLDLAQRRRRGSDCAATGTPCRSGGATTVPLEKAPWGDTFGMCTDKFGVNWMVNIAGTPS